MPPINPTASAEFVPKAIEEKDHKEVADAMGKMVMGKQATGQGRRGRRERQGWEGRSGGG